MSADTLDHLETSCFHFGSVMPHVDFELLCIKRVSVGPLLPQFFELLITFNVIYNTPCVAALVTTGYCSYFKVSVLSFRMFCFCV